MYKKLKIVKIDYKYCDYLRKFDNKVIYNMGTKRLRPFIGILFNVGIYEYFAPLSSPKEKHKLLKNKLDLMKINDGKYGVVNFNNMIPVTSNNYIEFDLNKKTNIKTESQRIALITKQLRWLTANRKEIYRKSKLLYNLYKKDRLPKSIKDRCCNFPLLEIKCSEYNKKNTIFF